MPAPPNPSFQCRSGLGARPRVPFISSLTQFVLSGRPGGTEGRLERCPQLCPSSPASSSTLCTHFRAPRRPFSRSALPGPGAVPDRRSRLSGLRDWRRRRRPPPRLAGAQARRPPSAPAPRPYREQLLQRAPHRHDLQLALLHLHGLRLATLQARVHFGRRKPQSRPTRGLRLHRHSQAANGRHSCQPAAPQKARPSHLPPRAPPPLTIEERRWELKRRPFPPESRPYLWRPLGGPGTWGWLREGFRGGGGGTKQAPRWGIV